VRRHILGILAATVAAPYLVLFLLSFSLLIQGGSAGLEGPLDLIKTLPLGTFALLMYGSPLLILSSLLAALLNALGWRSQWAIILGGATLGLCFMHLLFSSSYEPGKTGFPVLSIGAICGAVCGWIYWRIAIGRTTESTRAIDSA
jgi:hypothetical protein